MVSRDFSCKSQFLTDVSFALWLDIKDSFTRRVAPAELFPLRAHGDAGHLLHKGNCWLRAPTKRRARTFRSLRVFKMQLSKCPRQLKSHRLPLGLKCQGPRQCWREDLDCTSPGSSQRFSLSQLDVSHSWLKLRERKKNYVSLKKKKKIKRSHLKKHYAECDYTWPAFHKSSSSSSSPSFFSRSLFSLNLFEFFLRCFTFVRKVVGVFLENLKNCLAIPFSLCVWFSLVVGFSHSAQNLVLKNTR